MDLVIPDLDFFDEIEEKLKENKKSFLDTNVFIPSMYRKGKGISDNKLLNIFLNYYYSEEDYTNITEVRAYQKQYFGRLGKMLREYPNVTTIDKVVRECNDCIRYYTNKARELKKLQKGLRDRGPEKMRIFDANISINREKAKFIKHTLNTINGKYVFRRGSLGRLKLYDIIFESIEKNRKEEEIETNNYKTDQHLLANAFYLSAISGECMKIFTFDKHLYNLLSKSYWTIVDRLGYDFRHLDVSIEMIYYAEDRMVISEKNILRRNVIF
jgi:hypothetical protein